MVEAYIVRAIIAIIIIAINSAISGTFVIFKDVSFLVAGAAHAALAGAALAIVVSIYLSLYVNPVIGAIVFAVIIAIAAAGAKKSNIAIGIGFAASMSLAVLFISMIREQASRVWGLLFGDILLLTDRDIILMSVVTILILMFAIYFYREFIFISFDEEGARAKGINVNFFNYLLLSLIAISTVIIMKGVGAILTYAMLVAPAAAANSFSKNAIHVFILAGIIALVSGILGISIGWYINASPSAIASIIATLSYLLAFLKH